MGIIYRTGMGDAPETASEDEFGEMKCPSCKESLVIWFGGMGKSRHEVMKCEYCKGQFIISLR